MSESLDVSRNTLREVFRVLTKEGLLKHEPNRGVFVATPDVATIVDLYRVRRVIQCGVVEQAAPGHPSIGVMRAAVHGARQAREAKEWVAVGSEDLAFHAAIVALADSPRLNAFFSQISAEMRLAFGLLPDPEYLHAPFIELNEEIVQLVGSGTQVGGGSSFPDVFRPSGTGRPRSLLEAVGGLTAGSRIRGCAATLVMAGERYANFLAAPDETHVGQRGELPVKAFELRDRGGLPRCPGASANWSVRSLGRTSRPPSYRCRRRHATFSSCAMDEVLKRSSL